MHSSFISTKWALTWYILFSCTFAHSMENFWVEKVLDPSIEFRQADNVLIKAYLENKFAGLRSEPFPTPEGNAKTACEKYIAPIERVSDGRERVRDATQFPFYCIAHVMRASSNNEIFDETSSTGFLIGPHHLLMTAHSVYKESEFEKYGVAYSFRFGLNSFDKQFANKEKPFPVAQAARVLIPRAYIEAREKDANAPVADSDFAILDYDFALIILKESVGFQKGWFGCIFPSDTTLLAETITLVSYPSDLPLIENNKDTDYNRALDREQGFQQWASSGRAKSVTDETIYYPMMTAKNSSGCPIYITGHNGLPYAIGVHSQSESKQGWLGNLFGWGPGRSGVRFTESKFHHLMDAIGQTGMIIIAIPKSPSNPALLINFQKELLRRQQEQELNEKNRKEWRNYDLEWYRDEPVSIQELHIKASELAEHDAKHQEVKRLQTDFMQKWAALKTQSSEKIDVK